MCYPFFLHGVQHPVTEHIPSTRERTQGLAELLLVGGRRDKPCLTAMEGPEWGSQPCSQVPSCDSLTLSKCSNLGWAPFFFG